MRVRLRRLRPGEMDHELVWSGVTITGALVMLLWLGLALPWPRCAFHALVGLPCLTCGSTRAALAMAHGDLAQAWHHNPLASIALAAVALFDLYALVVVVTRAPRLRVAFSRGMRRAAVALLGSAALLNWIYLIRHDS